jgi:lipoprotein-anchoring transpeptidase ErfK/SrfK
MNTLVKIVVGALVAMMWAAPVSAQTMRSYDPATGRYITYDNIKLASVGGSAGTRAYTPIRRKLIRYDGPHKPGTIIVNTRERRLYHVVEDGRAWKYGVGVGREGFQWSGTNKLTRKAEWPGWTPPKVMIERERARGVILPNYMEGGINNPLGARALYIGSTIYRIHGSNQPWTIGSAVSSGCIRMVNDDVIHLYDRANVGSKVVVIR